MSYIRLIHVYKRGDVPRFTQKIHISLVFTYRLLHFRSLLDTFLLAAPLILSCNGGGGYLDAVCTRPAGLILSCMCVTAILLRPAPPTAISVFGTMRKFREKLSECVCIYSKVPHKNAYL